MDDDQEFVNELVLAVHNDFRVADYRVDYSDEGRDAVLHVELVAGDFYRIEIKEVHS